MFNDMPKLYIINDVTFRHISICVVTRARQIYRWRVHNLVEVSTTIIDGKRPPIGKYILSLLHSLHVTETDLPQHPLTVPF